MNTSLIKLTFFILSLIVTLSCQKTVGVKLNEIRIIGSHNSYKIGIEPAIWQMLYQIDSNQALSLQYEHIPMVDQLNMGLRNLEIDIFHDPLGGRYASPIGREMVRAAGVESTAFDEDSSLYKPGMKVFHVQDVDFRSHNLLFTEALAELKKWSKKNKHHIPVIITINTKDKAISDLTVPLPFLAHALDSVDFEIRSVFEEEYLITPDFVRGSYGALEDAVLARGWPNLEECRGKFLFVLDEKGQKRDQYLEGHISCKDRVMFVNVQQGNPAAAFMIVNNPIKNQENIQQMVKKGYMVRTRADAGTIEARNNDYTKFQAALSSKAQVITTDYYLPSKLFPSTYKIAFDGGGYILE